MKTLILVRHAKAISGEGKLEDIDRPLDIRGYVDAHNMGKKLAQDKIKIDLIVCSPAVRAYTTSLIFSHELDYNVSAIQLSPRLFYSDTDVYLDTISETEENINTLAVFGHNPTISSLFTFFKKDNRNDMPTCGVAILKLQTNTWQAIRNAQCHDSLFLFPSALRSV
jgi:phosphohistidine phosphatase